MEAGRLLRTLCALTEGNVQFILVGGLAAALNAAPINTNDVDVVHSRDAANIARLLPVLESLDAVYRIQPERRLRPTESFLVSSGPQNLVTRLGPLDLRGTIGRNLSYEDLLPHSVEMDIGNPHPRPRSGNTHRNQGRTGR